MAWDYLMFFPFDPAVGYCCRSPRVQITPEIRDQFKEDLFSNLPQFVERRDHLLKGKRHYDCETCWKLEAKGFKSSRHDQNILSSMKKNTGIQFNTIEELRSYDGLQRSNYANCIEIVLNNVCDAKCTYCNEVFSTQWYLEKKKFNDSNIMRTPEDKRDPQLEKYFWSWYKTIGSKELWRFGFIGGEPLIVDALYEYLDQLILIHDELSISTKKEICITTNMNTPPVYFKKFLEFIPKLEKHFKIILQVSGENLGKELEYIRSGVIAKRWMSNIEYLLENTQIQINFLPTLNLLCLPKFSKYLEYWEELCLKHKPIPIFDNIVTTPWIQSPMIAPKEFADFLDSPIEILERMKGWEKIPNDIRWSWDNFLTFLHSTRDGIKKNKSIQEMKNEAVAFYKYFYNLDLRRNTSVTNTFPEFKPIYDMGEELIKS
jgi:hypothetical protein